MENKTKSKWAPMAVFLAVIIIAVAVLSNDKIADIIKYTAF